jgi:hypothetical protein
MGMRDLLSVGGRSLLLLGAVAWAGAPTSASGQVTIDFQSLQHTDTINANHGATYSEDGFLLDGPGADYRTYGTLRSEFSGSTALYNDVQNGVTRLTQIGGGTFNLSSINLAELNSPQAASVTFIGTFGLGGTISQTHTLDGVAFGQQTFAFTGFTGLSQVTWTQVNPFHQFDNIVVAVPEPGAAMLAVIAIPLLRRRKR